MSVTQSQINAGKATVLDRLFKRYPAVRPTAIRLVVQAIKQGTVTEQEIGKEILNEAYQAIFGESPIGKHAFRHWLEDGCQDKPDDPTTGVGSGDQFDAEAIVVL